MDILICTPHFPHCAEMLRKYLPADNIRSCPADQVRAAVAEVDVIIPAMYRVDAEVIARTSAKIIHQFGVGLEGVDIPAATRRGLYVANVPGHEGAGNAASVAEHAIFLMLALARKFPRALDNVQRRVFGSPLGLALTGKTVAILGVGSIGAELARRLQGMQTRTLGIKQHPSEALRQELGLEFLGGPQDLARVLAEADFVVLALPVTPATRGIMNAAALARMKKSAFLINVGRGPVIDHDALIEVLARDAIAGAGLDVFWDEPTDPDDPLFRQNVIATPHLAGVTDLSYNDIARGLAANVNRLRAGLPPINCVNLAEVEALRRAQSGA
ncbi:MAG: hydroxyacid dehydrogenase [Deltaproteobacteria bacterium]|nr:hydroxyacid dehydrogenase [Deltaproteobacteria bacterium]